MEIKNLNLRKYKEEIVFIPLGGSNEIGLNCNLYQYGGKWIIVDCGIGFVKELPGIDIMVPDTTFFKKFKKDILGIFLTHIHEDHLGAIQYIWKELRAPIFASKFTKCFLYEKLKEYDFYNEVEINEMNEGDNVKLGPFEVESLNLTHSTPEMNAFIIKTPKGNILHTGDWKFDPNPVVGQKSNIKRLKQLGSRKEILATVCDSTNIFSEREKNSEGELYNSLYSIVKDKKGIVVFTTFASNVGRIKTIAQIAKKTKRKVVVIGSSLFRLIRVAKEVGFLEENFEFLSEEELKDYKKRNLIIISTGCQGEWHAGTEKLATNSLKNVHLRDGDCVIFSSSVIPGNEKDLISLYNKFAENDVEVITEKDDFVHVSGHYTLNDLKAFYSYVKPKIAIAVHGEAMHLLEHQKVAKSCGIKNTVKSTDGMILKISKEKTEKIGQIDIKPSFVDGKRILSLGDEVIKTRKKMEDVGAVFVDLLITERYRLLQNPVVSAPGGYDFAKDKVTKEILLEDIITTYNNCIKQINDIRQNNKKRFTTEAEKQHFIDQKLRTAINSLYDNDIGKKPYIEIFFTKIKQKSGTAGVK